MNEFSISNLGPIKSAHFGFGQLTFLIGPQGSGKSICLQTFKLIKDRLSIANELRRNNFIYKNDNPAALDLFYGESLGSVWTDKSLIKIGNKSYKKSDILPKQRESTNDTRNSIYYIPAQRIFAISDGWPKLFGSYSISDPFVLKQFSESIRILLERETVSGPGSNDIFPRNRSLKQSLRNVLNKTIFHQAQVIRDDSSGRRRMLLRVGDTNLPFMTWSAGQKEFMPLLLALYHLTPSGKGGAANKYEYVIIEEPEMGLHPQAIVSFILFILELIQRGYQIIVSTHSTVFLEWAWMQKYLRESGLPDKIKKNRIADLFDLEHTDQTLSGALTVALSLDPKVYYLDFDHESGISQARDISALHVDDADSGTPQWGGIAEFSGRINETVAALCAKI